VKVRVSEKLAPGILVLPRHSQLEWHKLKTLPARISLDRIEKRVV
jgi:hypothetical protein